jgi:hypothetical protein
MNVVRRGQAGSDVEKLPDAGLADQVADHPAQDGPLGLDADLNLGKAADNPVADLAVSREIVLPAEQVVVHPSRVGTRGVKGVVGRFGAHESDCTDIRTPSRLMRTTRSAPAWDNVRRRSAAHRVSWCRDESWSLRSTDETWLSTVLPEMNSSRAISL